MSREDDFFEELVEEEILLELMACGNCRGTCRCGYGRRQNPVTQLIEAEIAVEIAEDLFGF